MLSHFFRNKKVLRIPKIFDVYFFDGRKRKLSTITLPAGNISLGEAEYNVCEANISLTVGEHH